jgi:hypothetical protein
LSSNDNSKKALKGNSPKQSKVTADSSGPKEKKNPHTSLVFLVKKVLSSLTNLAKSKPSSALALATALQGILSIPHVSNDFFPFVLASVEVCLGE